MNLRRALAWLHHRLTAAAEEGRLSVRDRGRMVKAVDGADVDAWLVGDDLPSRIAMRETGPHRLAALGGEVAS